MKVSPDRLFLFLVGFSLAGSLITKVTGLDAGPIAPVTSVLTLGCGVVATFSEYLARVPRAWVRVLLALGIGAASELVGLATGFPFGRYAYTDEWWPTVGLPIGRFPLMLPLAWLLMAGASVLAARRLFVSVWAAAVAGGLIAAIVDLAMEPVMAGTLGYWRWLQQGPLPGGAPVANFLGWWATGTIAGAILTVGVPVEALESRRPALVLALFVVLVLGLALIGKG